MRGSYMSTSGAYLGCAETAGIGSPGIPLQLSRIEVEDHDFVAPDIRFDNPLAGLTYGHSDHRARNAFPKYSTELRPSRWIVGCDKRRLAGEDESVCRAGEVALLLCHIAHQDQRRLQSVEGSA